MIGALWPAHPEGVGSHVAPSSSGLGRSPLKAEIAGSNPAGATPTKLPYAIEKVGYLARSIPPRHHGGYLAFRDVQLLEEGEEELAAGHRVARLPRLQQSLQR
jgi:hypothetical protein